MMVIGVVVRRRVDGVGAPRSIFAQGVGDYGPSVALPESRRVHGRLSWCLPVEMKDPGSISLSLPVMRAAREVTVAACGVSELERPQGKV